MGGQDSSANRQTTAVAGGSSTEKTPANASGNDKGLGQKLFGYSGGDDAGQSQGAGHAAAPNPASTMGSFLGLDDQKSRAESKYLQRANQVGGSTSQEGDPSGVTHHDSSFMEKKPGDPDTYPGWNAVKNLAGGLSGNH